MNGHSLTSSLRAGNLADVRVSEARRQSRVRNPFGQSWCNNMSELSAAVQAVIDLAQKPITTYQAFPRGENEGVQDYRLQNLLRLCRQASVADRDSVLRALAPTIATADPFQAGLVTVICGTIVERGASPALVVGAILDRLPNQLALAGQVAPQIKDTSEQQLFVEAPEQLKAWKGLRFMLLAAMTTLCRDLEARHTARRNRALVEGLLPLKSVSTEADFLSQVLALTDGLELLVLHPRKRKAFRVVLEAVNTNFHLFTLLQDALVGRRFSGMMSGPRPDPQVVARAKGEVHHGPVLFDSARWHYYNWYGLYTAQQWWLRRVQPGLLGATIWGEGKPRDIPSFEDKRIVILGAPLFSRTWDSNFFANIHEALRSRAEVVEVLEKTVVTDWLTRIREATALAPCAG